MPMYDYRCDTGHRYERVVALADASVQACPACGSDSVKIPSRVALHGMADVGRPMELMPQTWRGTHDGNREYVRHLQGEWDRRQRLEDKHPELQGDRRPVLAHEGRYEHAPLRLGDPLPGAGSGDTSTSDAGTPAAAPAHPHGHAHGHSPGHSHGHVHGHIHP